MRVSIIIPVYNEEAYLDACLAAIARQSVAPDEVIVVDNNSSDGSAAVARRYPFVQVTRESQQGAVFAQNSGFRAARGDILARIDADTRLPADWVERLLRAFSDDPTAAAVTGPPRFYDTPLPRFFDFLQTLLYQRLQRVLTGTYIVWGANMAVRREAWEKVAKRCSRRTDIDEDIDLSFCLHRENLKIRYQPGLRAGASLQRGRTDMRSSLRYLSTWHRDYWLHRMYVRGLSIAVMIWIIIPLSAPFMWLLRQLPGRRSDQDAGLEV